MEWFFSLIPRQYAYSHSLSFHRIMYFFFHFILMIVMNHIRASFTALMIIPMHMHFDLKSTIRS